MYSTRNRVLELENGAHPAEASEGAILHRYVTAPKGSNRIAQGIALGNLEMSGSKLEAKAGRSPGGVRRRPAANTSEGVSLDAIIFSSGILRLAGPAKTPRHDLQFPGDSHERASERETALNECDHVVEALRHARPGRGGGLH